MPVIKSNPPVVEAYKIPTITEVASKEYKHSVVDSKHSTQAALLTFISGYPYITEYYSQVLGSSESPAAFDMTQSSAYQQYDRIQRYQMMLQSELSTSFDSANSEATVTGSAILYPYLKANVGDVFIGDIGNGQAGLMQVTEVYPKTIRKLTCYEIQFKLFRYMDQEVEDNLTAKIVKDYQFKKDLIVYGQNPLMLSDEVTRNESLEALYFNTLDRFFRDFYSREYSTLLVPNQSLPTYDPYATRAFVRLVSVDDDVRIKSVILLNCDDFGLNDQMDPWDMLIKKDEDRRGRVFRTAGLINVSAFPPTPRHHGIRYTGIKRVVVPVEHRDDNSKLDSRYPTVTSWMNFSEVTGIPITSAGMEDAYVLGEYFYTGSRENMFALERAADKSLSGESISLKEFNLLYKTINDSPADHRFYMQLILLILLRLEIRRE